MQKTDTQPRVRFFMYPYVQIGIYLTVTTQVCHFERAERVEGSVPQKQRKENGFFDFAALCAASLRMTVVVFTRLRRFEQNDKLKFIGPAAKKQQALAVYVSSALASASWKSLVSVKISCL